MNLGIIGVGNMASAILQGIFKNDIFPTSSINLYDPYSQIVFEFEKQGCRVCMNVDELISQSDLIIVAVKPNNIESVLDEISVDTVGKCFISIAAGISTEYIKSVLGESVHVIRVMPNTPITIGLGATAIAVCNDVPEMFSEKAVSIFSSSGAVVFIDEELINVATAVNGSGPAYFFSMADEMIKTAVSFGIDPQSALLLTAKTMEGASRMLLESGKSSSDLTKAVSSPGGTTVAALTEMKKCGFYDALVAGMNACIKRAEEIGK
ncbi:MAG: pyrroline-5-carboxylate reductase [Clostridiales bacterium]|mgnify:CR=1 FL=1|jgi:pyrroline-5-carboxylate reductase|nr:pyrroline-5-carboxylate reductase [Clostridiales bacterium]